MRAQNSRREFLALHRASREVVADTGYILFDASRHCDALVLPPLRQRHEQKTLGTTVSCATRRISMHGAGREEERDDSVLTPTLRSSDDEVTKPDAKGASSLNSCRRRLF
jgi:hypothetical protein